MCRATREVRRTLSSSGMVRTSAVARSMPAEWRTSEGGDVAEDDGASEGGLLADGVGVEFDDGDGEWECGELVDDGAADDAVAGDDDVSLARGGVGGGVVCVAEGRGFVPRGGLGECEAAGDAFGEGKEWRGDEERDARDGGEAGDEVGGEDGRCFGGGDGEDDE